MSFPLDEVLRDHIKEETSFKKHMEERLDKGEDRMESIERKLEDVHELATSFRGFSKSLNIIAALGTSLVALFVWILLEKNKQFEEIQAAIKTQGEAIVKLIHSHQELEKDTAKEFGWIKESIRQHKGN
jgi:prefoldin subunit 5